jgi:hypothetical protein
MDKIDPVKLFPICKDLFRTDREIEILAHAALAFCWAGDRGRAFGFSSQRITDGINALFSDATVEDATVKRFVWRSTIRPRDDLVAKVATFIISECIKDETILQRPVLQPMLSIWDFVSEVKSRLQLTTSDSDIEINQERYFEGIIRGFRHIAENPEAEDIFENFFGSNDRDLNDICYYLSYRHSLTHGMLIKTFLSISTPAYNRKHAFEYLHMHRHTVSRGSVHAEILRRSRGVLIGLNRSYYLLGSSVLRRLGGRWPRYAEGIHVISLEKDQFTQGLPGLTSLFFTNNNTMCPMSGRSALIPLGRKSKIGEQSYEDFDLDTFAIRRVDKVVHSDLERFPHIDKAQAIAFIRDVIDLNHLDLERIPAEELCYLVRKPAVARPWPA